MCLNLQLCWVQSRQLFEQLNSFTKFMDLYETLFFSHLWLFCHSPRLCHLGQGEESTQMPLGFFSVLISIRFEVSLLHRNCSNLTEFLCDCCEFWLLTPFSLLCTVCGDCLTSWKLMLESSPTDSLSSPFLVGSGMSCIVYSKGANVKFTVVWKYSYYKSKSSKSLICLFT